MSEKVYEQRYDHLGGLAAENLRDIARNEAAEPRWRKAAVEIMLDKGYAYASSPEFAFIVAEIKAEREAKHEVESIVESAIEAELPKQEPVKPSPKSKK